MFLSYPGLELADDAFAAYDCIGLDLLQSHGQVLHLNLQRLLDSFNLDNTLLFLVQDLDGVLELGLHSLVSLVADSQLLGDLIVISSQGRQFLLDFGP